MHRSVLTDRRSHSTVAGIAVSAALWIRSFLDRRFGGVVSVVFAASRTAVVSF
jgi:hypothetical protein